jgi:hypothetical protein
MQLFPARPPLAVLLIAVFGLVAVWGPVSLAQTPAGKTSEPAAPQGTLADTEEDLYILEDLPEPAPAEPKLDLGKVGKKGKLSLERMPGAGEGEDEGKPKGAAGILLKIPLGKQGE